jgi:ribokinase
MDVVGFGALNIDQFFQVGSILTDDETTIFEQQRLPGGSAANTVYGLAKLGLRTGFMGAVGDDEGGKILLEDFRRVGVDVSQIKVKKKAKTGSVLGLIDKNAGRALYVEPGANNLLELEDLSKDYSSQARLVHLSSFVDEKQLELQKVLVAHLPSNVRVSFAPGAIYARKGLEALMPIIERTYTIFVNRKEIRLLTNKGIEEGAKQLKQYGCKIVVVTLGEGINCPTDGEKGLLLALGEEWGGPISNWGSYIVSERGVYWVKPVIAEQVVDTTGAGDAFAAGFLYGLLTERSLKECAHLGHIVAFFCVSRIGARPGLPSQGELQQVIQKNQTMKKVEALTD